MNESLTSYGDTFILSNEALLQLPLAEMVGKYLFWMSVNLREHIEVSAWVLGTIPNFEYIPVLWIFIVHFHLFVSFVCPSQFQTQFQP